jgi:D-alanine transaminase
MIVYLNGEYLPYEDARISVDDRGFVFADGIYEVARIYDGHIFLFEPHLMRLRHGLGELRINADIVSEIPSIAERLLDANNMRTGDATLYIQVTRGAAPRAHAFPPSSVKPTVFIATKPFKQHPDEFWEKGVSAITVKDTRWSRCDIKSIALLPNILANQQAKDAGAFEALFVRDGQVIEGSHSNFFGVLDGELRTYASCGYILTGITRLLVVDKAGELDIPLREEAIPLDRLFDATELFLSGTTTEVMPVTRVDGKQIGDGKPGPVTQRLRERFRTWIEDDIAGATSAHGADSKTHSS